MGCRSRSLGGKLHGGSANGLGRKVQAVGVGWVLRGPFGELRAGSSTSLRMTARTCNDKGNGNCKGRSNCKGNGNSNSKGNGNSRSSACGEG